MTGVTLSPYHHSPTSFLLSHMFGSMTAGSCRLLTSLSGVPGDRHSSSPSSDSQENPLVCSDSIHSNPAEPLCSCRHGPPPNLPGEYRPHLIRLHMRGQLGEATHSKTDAACSTIGQQISMNVGEMNSKRHI